MVFVYHVVHSGLPTFDLFAKGLLGEALQTGKFGVEFFFGISGIVILPSLYRASSVATFFLDRCARILPVLWATVIAIAIFGWLSGKGAPSLLLVGANLLAPPPFIDIVQINPAVFGNGACAPAYEVFDTNGNAGLQLLNGPGASACGRGELCAPCANPLTNGTPSGICY